MTEATEHEHLGNIWRLPLRGGGPGGVDHTKQVNYCLKKWLAAVGWGSLRPVPTRPADALLCIETQYSKRARATVARFINAADHDLVWTMHTDGTYRVGELRGPWRYNKDPEGQALDCYQVRPTQWSKALLASDVPGAVVRSFSGRGSTFSEIHSQSAVRYSHLIFDALAGRAPRVPACSPTEILCDHLDPYDVEDLVYVYLQVAHGYLALPASRRRDTAAYEYVLVHRESGRQAIAQVKTGKSFVDMDKLRSAAAGTHEAFAYSTGGCYQGDRGGVVVLTNDELLRFAADHEKALPPRVRAWFSRAAK